MRREKSLRIGVHHADAVVWEPVYRTHLRRMSSIAPDAWSAAYKPPFPSGAVATSCLDFMIIFPSSSKHGSVPCWKNAISDSGSPK